MTDKVRITVRGIRIMDGEKECVEEAGEGDYYRRNGKHYILWRRNGDMVKRIRIAHDSMTVAETNGGNAMEFQEGRETSVTYTAAGGRLVMELRTRRFHLDCQEKFLEAEVEYALYHGGIHMSDHHIKVTVRPRD